MQGFIQALLCESRRLKRSYPQGLLGNDLLQAQQLYNSLCADLAAQRQQVKPHFKPKTTKYMGRIKIIEPLLIEYKPRGM